MIIVSITGPSPAEALAQIRASSRYAAMFEIRLDLIDGLDISAVRRSTRKPLTVTCRPSWEGGRYAGEESDRLAMLDAVCRNGIAFVDLEAQLGKEAIRAFMRSHPTVRVIASRHYFGAARPSIASDYRTLRALGTHVIKLAFEAGDAWENGLAMEFLRRASQDHQNAVAIAMGEAGEASRVLYRRFGGWATYAAPEGGPSAAPGQVSARILHDLYRADHLSARTRLFGLIGDPVRYSKGIAVHNTLLKKMHVNGVYCRFPVKDLRHFMVTVGREMDGLSVTLPHKLAVMDELQSVEASACATGAVNTVVRKRGMLVGSNTDGAGAMDAIESVLRVHGKTMLILGTGGAARAVIAEAVRRGARVTVAGRSAEKAKALAEAFGIAAVNLAACRDADIVANCTSVGMMPEPEQTPIPTGTIRMRVAFDAVYNPVETRFLREARENGAKTVTGLQMYLNQAALQFKAFTGKQPPRARSLHAFGLHEQR